MDFFEAQEVARKRTKLLVFYFVLAILGIVVAVYGLLLAITTFAGEPSPEGVVVFNPWQPTLLLIAAVGSLAVILLGSGFKVLQLASGGGAGGPGARRAADQHRHHGSGGAAPAERRRRDGDRVGHPRPGRLPARARGGHQRLRRRVFPQRRRHRRDPWLHAPPVP